MTWTRPDIYAAPVLPLSRGWPVGSAAARWRVVTTERALMLDALTLAPLVISGSGQLRRSCPAFA
jgi:hypothetical protein